MQKALQGFAIFFAVRCVKPKWFAHCSWKGCYRLRAHQTLKCMADSLNYSGWVSYLVTAYQSLWCALISGSSWHDVTKRVYHNGVQQRVWTARLPSKHVMRKGKGIGYQVLGMCMLLSWVQAASAVPSQSDGSTPHSWDYASCRHDWDPCDRNCSSLLSLCSAHF